MAGNGIVTLEFVADTGKFVAGTEQVSASSRKVEADLDNVSKATNRANYQSMVAAHGVRELAASALMLSSRMPAAAQTTALTAMAVGDLGGAFFRIAPAAQNLWAKMGALTKGVTAVGVAVAATYAAWEIGTAIGNKFNDMLGRGESAANRAADALYREADAAIAAAQHTRELNSLVAELNYHSNNGQYGPNDAQIQGPVPLDTHGNLLNSTNGGNSFAAAQEEHVRRLRAVHTRTASAANALALEAKRLAEQRLQEWQSVADKYTQIAKQIQESLAPKIEARQEGGPSLIEKMRKQLLDTIQLRKDLSRLSSMHLNKDTMKTLIEGGLDSLPAAEEILRGGRVGVGAVNDLNRQINAQAFRIGSSEAQREFKNRDREVTVKFDINGGDAEFKKMFKKWIRTDGAVSFGLKAA